MAFLLEPWSVEVCSMLCKGCNWCCVFCLYCEVYLGVLKYVVCCVKDVIGVVFSVCIVRCGGVGARVWKYECLVKQMLYVCFLCASCGSSQCCILHDL